MDSNLHLIFYTNQGKPNRLFRALEDSLISNLRYPNEGITLAKLDLVERKKGKGWVATKKGRKAFNIIKNNLRLIQPHLRRSIRGFKKNYYGVTFCNNKIKINSSSGPHFYQYYRSPDVRHIVFFNNKGRPNRLYRALFSLFLQHNNSGMFANEGYTLSKFNLVTSGTGGWQITDAGRCLMKNLIENADIPLECSSHFYRGVDLKRIDEFQKLRELFKKYKKLCSSDLSYSIDSYSLPLFLEPDVWYSGKIMINKMGRIIFDKSSLKKD
jgi:hypothetical protein